MPVSFRMPILKFPNKYIASQEAICRRIADCAENFIYYAAKSVCYVDIKAVHFQEFSPGGRSSAEVLISYVPNNARKAKSILVQMVAIVDPENNCPSAASWLVHYLRPTPKDR